MPTPTKGGYLYLSKGCRDLRHPSLVIPDTGVSLNVSPLPAVGITDVRYLTSGLLRVAEIIGGEGREKHIVF